MRRPGIAEDAAMLAAPVGIDGLVVGDVGGVVAGNDAASGIRLQLRGDAGRGFFPVPAIVDTFALLPVESVGRIAQRAAPLEPASRNCCAHGLNCISIQLLRQPLLLPQWAGGGMNLRGRMLVASHHFPFCAVRETQPCASSASSPPYSPL